MIKNIVFDMGNVLIRFDRELYLSQLGISAEDQALLMREVFVSSDWCCMDRGSKNEAEALASMCTRLPERLHKAAEDIVFRWDDPILPVEGMEELIRELKELGCGIYLLSNASRRQHEYWPRIPGSQYFDGKLVSADEFLLKPQPEIYHRLCEKFSLNMAECIFIDDLPANAEGAIFSGMPAIVFHGDVSLLRKKLREYGVSVKE